MWLFLIQYIWKWHISPGHSNSEKQKRDTKSLQFIIQVRHMSTIPSVGKSVCYWSQSWLVWIVSVQAGEHVSFPKQGSAVLKMSTPQTVTDKERGHSPEGMTGTCCPIMTCFVLQWGVAAASSDIMSHDHSYSMWKSTECSSVSPQSSVYMASSRLFKCYAVCCELNKMKKSQLLHYQKRNIVWHLDIVVYTSMKH